MSLLSLFTKAIKDVDIDDVITFCNEGIEEGIRVEYKQDFTKNDKLAREIASFANTYGGLLLIGVAEKDRKPVLPLIGIDLEPGIDEKINSIAFKGINPPVFPEIKICQFKDNPNKAIIIIRVYESDDTPHRVEQDTKVYLRVSSQKEPVLAPFEEIEWLINRRKKAIDNRERILLRAEKRFFEKYKKTERELKRAIPGQKQVGISLHPDFRPIEYKLPSTRGISIVPLYPHQALLSYLKLKNMIDLSSTHSFPGYRTGRSATSMQGSIIYSQNDGGVCHTEINSLGLILHREDFSIDEINPQNYKSIIDVDLTMNMIYSVLSFAVSLYKNVGFWGTVKISLMFDQILGKNLSFGNASNNLTKNEFDNQIAIERGATVFELAETIDEMAIDIFREVLWSFSARQYAETSNIDQILERVKMQN